MEMIDIFKDTLQMGMEISKCKELSNKYKFVLSYNGMNATCELNKLCTPGNERSLCMQAIDTAMSSMYIDKGDLKEAEAWLHGERWGCNGKNKVDNTMEFTEKEIDQIKDALIHLHEADLSEYGEENIKVLEGLMDKLGMDYSSWLD